MTTRVYVGIGSNLNNPKKQVESAIDFLKMLKQSTFIAASDLYYSKPMGPQDQPDYVNAVVSMDTTLDAHDCLDLFLGYETEQGRVRAEKWGPRIIDLDILLYGESVIDDDRLKVPHPGLMQREFVLKPLRQIAPELILPTEQRTSWGSDPFVGDVGV